jgi:hypothetical protein
VGVFGGGVAGVWDDVDAVAEVCAGSCGAFDRLRRSPRGSSSGNATALAVARLQRDPDSEEPEAPLVETGIPDRVHRVSPVIEWRWRRPIPWREWPIPCWRRRSTPAPRRGSVAPRSTTPLPVEVSTLPGRRPTVVARAALVARTLVCGGSTGSAMMVLRRRASNRSALVVLRRGCAVTRLTGGRRRDWRGVSDGRTHPAGGHAESSRDGCRRDRLLDLHVHLQYLSCDYSDSPEVR